MEDTNVRDCSEDCPRSCYCDATLALLGGTYFVYSQVDKGWFFAWIEDVDLDENQLIEERSPLGGPFTTLVEAVTDCVQFDFEEFGLED